jgi:putative addiction module component (TIGR02574 family)
MSKAEILAEIAKLTPTERTELWEEMWTLEGQLLGTELPTPEEKALLEQEWDDFQKNPEPGKSWEEIERRLRKQS